MPIGQETDWACSATPSYLGLVFTALHGMQMWSSDEISVRPSNVCLSVRLSNA